MDIGDDSSVLQGMEEILGKTSKLDVVVNNAGFAYVGINEAFTSADAMDTFNGNIVGAMRVNNAALPAMRQAGEGLLIHITSASAHNHLPFMSVYSGAKAAMDVIAEGYHLELNKLGINSCIIEPGAFPTEGMGNVREPGHNGIVAEYGPVAATMENFFSGMGDIVAQYPEQNPQDIADAVKQLVDQESGQRPLRQVVGGVMSEHAKKINEFSEPLQRDFYGHWGVGALIN